MPSQRLAPSLPPVTEGDEEARSGDISDASALRKDTSARGVDASASKASEGRTRGERTAVQGESGAAANQMCRDDSMTSTPRSEKSECRTVFTPNELLQLCDAWAAPWEDRRPHSQSASPAPRASNSSSQPLDLQRALSCDRASLSSIGLSTPSPARTASGSGRISASPGRGSGGITPQPNASPGLLPPHSPMVLREWEEFLFVKNASPSPTATFHRSRLGAGSGESASGCGESVSGLQLDSGSANNGGIGGNDPNIDPALRNIRLPIHKVVRSSWPRYRLRRRDHFGVAMEGVAEGDEENEDDDSSPSSPAVAGAPGRSDSDSSATDAPGLEQAASVAVTIFSEAAIGSQASHVAKSGTLSVSQRLAANGSPAAGNSRPVSRRLSGQMRLGDGASGKSGLIDGSAGDRRGNDSSEGFVNMAEGMMAGGNAGKLFQLLEQVDKHGDYFRGDVEDPDLTSSMDLDEEATDDEPGNPFRY
ncbi:unnamed protein product [Closterium sp. NIES-53]